ncbi:MAG TPA: antibiotic biosynthesis monooxygenase family protein [Rubricoccaceae bacterium]|nr:antibiotic biosynthesis monooxygenase family protein [Rubricoccaceae bacterium]
MRAVLIRTVRMTFRPDALEAFLDLFRASAPHIRAFPGCRHLALWADERFPNILTTYSLWDGPESLARYRESDLFRSTWARTTPLFAAPPVAHSQHTLIEVEG